MSTSESSATASAHQPLAGVRILDLATVVAAPLASTPNGFDVLFTQDSPTDCWAAALLDAIAGVLLGRTQPKAFAVRNSAFQIPRGLACSV